MAPYPNARPLIAEFGPVPTGAEAARRSRNILSTLPPATVHFARYFESGSDDLTAESQALTTRILELVKSRPSPDVILVGHTDTMDTAASNFELGLQRATIVLKMLVAAGLDATAIAVTSHGVGSTNLEIGASKSACLAGPPRLPRLRCPRRVGPTAVAERTNCHRQCRRSESFVDWPVAAGRADSGRARIGHRARHDVR